MTEWKAKRFWKSATVEAEPGGWGVRLDGRPLRTPLKNPLTVPTEALARAIASEWDAQSEVIDPTSMPVTRAANSAIEKVTPQRAEVIEMLAEYGDSNLTCYRAAHPEALVARQAEAWDPLLDWAAERHGARLIPVQGVMHQPQPPAALGALRAALEQFDAFELTAVHDLVTLSGSLVIGLAATEPDARASDLWDTAQVDECWQIEQWGEDEEAAQAAEHKRNAFLAARQFFEHCKN